jgi:nitrite reductase/ring-hydroxylating ferredoxin subunit
MSEMVSEAETGPSTYKVAQSVDLLYGSRLHTRVEGRYITIFRYKGALTAMDAICHHAGGPLTLGEIKDIEELGTAVVLCPWHKYAVSLEGGRQVYQGVDIIDGKPVKAGWRKGKMTQRPHDVFENDGFIYLTLNALEEGACVSDTDAKSELCAKNYAMHSFVPERVDKEAICLK